MSNGMSNGVVYALHFIYLRLTRDRNVGREWAVDAARQERN